ncbi:MAG: hypothetical protein QOF18_930 [Frankiaceae bacterium]|nr:hypothetical protein [Frankiaceae bacterium]
MRRPRRAGAAQLLVLGALGVGALLIAQLLGFGAGLLWPASAATVGAAILWRQADDAQRARWRAATSRATTRLPQFTHIVTRGLVARSVLGLLLVTAGMTGFLAAHGALTQARRALLPIFVVIVGLVVIAGPWVLETVRELTEERRARIREQERAEFAARVHDSVLQTLTLIQRNASDPIEVLRLARGSERELRGWLYTPRGDGPATLQAALLAAAADVEDEHGVQVDVVTVGDVPADERVGAVVQAAREAMVNAAKSSGAPTVSVFAEVTDGRVQVFVRDRGRGFDLAAVPADRYGVRESIVARMARNGGTAEIRTAPGSGTEVRLDLPPTAAVRP